MKVRRTCPECGSFKFHTFVKKQATCADCGSKFQIRFPYRWLCKKLLEPIPIRFVLIGDRNIAKLVDKRIKRVQDDFNGDEEQIPGVGSAEEDRKASGQSSGTQRSNEGSASLLESDRPEPIRKSLRDWLNS